MTDSSGAVLAAARTAAHKAYRATPSDGDPVEAALDAYTTALTSAGLLDIGGIDDRSASKVAQWLAAQSRFPRYASGDGWRLLLDSDTDVMLAYQKATGLGSGDPRESVRAGLAEARDMLLRYVADRRGRR